MKLKPRDSKLSYPVQNLIDLLWKDKPRRPKDPIFLHPLEFAGKLYFEIIGLIFLTVIGKSAKDKIKEIRSWIRHQPNLSKDKDPKDAPYATLLTSLADIGKFVIEE